MRKGGIHPSQTIETIIVCRTYGNNGSNAGPFRYVTRHRFVCLAIIVLCRLPVNHQSYLRAGENCQKFRLSVYTYIYTYSSGYTIRQASKRIMLYCRAPIFPYIVDVNRFSCFSFSLFFFIIYQAAVYRFICTLSLSLSLSDLLGEQGPVIYTKLESNLLLINSSLSK